MINNEWTLVKSKKNKNPKLKKYIRTWYATPTKKDMILTPEEKQLINESKFKNIICCNCCFSYIISDIICRTFVSCDRCYCCVGDDPTYDDIWYINNITRIHKFNEYAKDYHYTNDSKYK